MAALRTRRTLACVGLAALLVAHCTHRPLEPFLGSARVHARVRWPRPPEPARVAYLTEIGESEGFRPPRSLLRRLGDWVTGRTPERFVRPAGIAVRDQKLAVADPGRAAVHLLDLASRAWEIRSSVPGGRLVSPVGVAFMPDGSLLVSDSATHVVWRYEPSGRSARRFTAEVLERPTGLAVDAARGRVWIAETLAHRIRSFDFAGREVSRVGERGSGTGQFNYPVRLAPDGSGGVWVTDALNFRIQHVAARGPVDRTFGIAGDRAGAFARPRGLAVDPRGRLLVVDALFDAIQVFRPDGTLLLVFGGRGSGPGEFWLPSDVVLDAADRIYVADSYNRRVQIFAYLPPQPPQ